MNKFFKELKRRNVIKSTFAYLVVSWIIIQVALAVLPTFGASEAVVQVIIIVLAIGLPIWIIISWIYDITPEGFEKTPIESEKQIYKELINKRTNAFIIVSLFIAVIVMGLKLSNVFSSDSNEQYAIAVLPFVNMSDDKEQEYFSDGISEEIINMIAHVPELKVIARTSSFSFKGKNQDVKDIGEKLKVSHILEGSVRKSGNTLRITAQLVNTSSGYHLYSETFDRELDDIFDIQDEISQNILDAIKIELLGEKKEAIFKKYTNNVEAYELYLKGKFYYNQYTKEAFLKAIDYFNEAIAIDPNYAIAYAGISYCYMTLLWFNWMPADQALPIALEAAQKSNQLDDLIAESHLAIGRIKLHHEWNIRDAKVEFKKAIAINPNDPEILVQLAFCANLTSRNEEAMEYANKAIGLDPFSLMNVWMASIASFYNGDFNNHFENGNRLIELAPDFYGGYSIIAENYMLAGQYEEALENFKIAANFVEDDYNVSCLGYVYGIMGDHDKAREIIEKLKKMDGIVLFRNHSIGHVYKALGELDTAFEYFNKAAENREGIMLWFKLNHPDLLEDPRAAEILEKINVIY